MNDPEEQVLCVPTHHVPHLAAVQPFQGFQTCGTEVLDVLLQAGYWKKRELAESDPAFKQIITYAFLHKKDGSLLWYRRSKQQGDQRLLGKASLGFGGHVNRGDGGDRGDLRTVHAALARELTEELGIVGFTPEFRGLVNDDSDDVGRVHLGLVFSVTWLDGTLPSLKEGDGAYALGFHPVDQPPVDSTEMESWSRLVWKHLQQRAWS